MRRQQEDFYKLNKEFEVQLAAMKLQLQRTNEIRNREVSLFYHWLYSISTNRPD